MSCEQVQPIQINPKGAGTEFFQLVKIMVTDALAPCVARTSAPMILIM